jgi:predicted ArsR family transcriptional regulator
MADVSDAKRRILDRLKRAESLTAPELAAEFALTDTAIRQHLEALEQAGLVQRHTAAAAGRGRPPVHWSLTAVADGLFADRHAELTVELLESVRTTLGDDALDQVVQARSRRQLAAYRDVLAGAATIDSRVQLLAELRTGEGYLAEATIDGDDLLLVEHHCPVGEAARACSGLCAAELQLFRDALGHEVTVEREQHLLAGAHRCAYRISPGAARR